MFVLSMYNILNFQDFVEKIERSYNNIYIEMGSISKSLKEGLSRFPLCENLKRIFKEFKKGISTSDFVEDNDKADKDDVDAAVNKMNDASISSDESQVKFKFH